MRVAIIGGGLSGLSAAYYLPRGFRVTMFERDRKVGGRAQTSSSFGGEEGAEFLLGTETAIHSLLKRLGIPCYRIRELVGVRFRGRYACGSFRTVAQQLLPRRSAKAVKSLLALTPRYSKYSTAPADGWLRKKLHGDREAMAFLQMILAGETCAPLNHLGVRFLLGCLYSDSWYRIRGGSGRLAKTLRARCRAKGRMTLKLRTHVESVRESDGAVTVHWSKGGRRSQARFDGVIIATPKGETLAGMRPQGHFHSYVSVLLQYRRAWWKEENPSLRKGFVTGFYSDGPLNYVQQASRTPRGRRTLRILLPDADRERAWSNAQIRHMCFAGLRDISSLSEKPIRSRITRWPEGLPCVGREEQAGKEKAKPISKRVYLAGDRFGEWPSMNAAIVSGKQAARLLAPNLTKLS